jgi:hypothetical protein
MSGMSWFFGLGGRPLPGGEMERLELVDALVERMRGPGDAAELAVCLRLLEHLEEPRGTAGLRLR